jgi:hypothetical protein
VAMLRPLVCHHGRLRQDTPGGQQWRRRSPIQKRPASTGVAAHPAAQAAAAAARQDGEQLVWEVWDVVDRDFLDARGAGFDRAQWAAARDAALAGGFFWAPRTRRFRKSAVGRRACRSPL